MSLLISISFRIKLSILKLSISAKVETFRVAVQVLLQKSVAFTIYN
jgi:hypothetical protein